MVSSHCKNFFLIIGIKRKKIHKSMIVYNKEIIQIISLEEKSVHTIIISAWHFIGYLGQ